MRARSRTAGAAAYSNLRKCRNLCPKAGKPTARFARRGARTRADHSYCADNYAGRDTSTASHFASASARYAFDVPRQALLQALVRSPGVMIAEGNGAPRYGFLCLPRYLSFLRCNGHVDAGATSPEYLRRASGYTYRVLTIIALQGNPRGRLPTLAGRTAALFRNCHKTIGPAGQGVDASGA